MSADAVEAKRLTLDGANRTAGEEMNVSGEGIMFDACPAEGVELSFNDDPRRVPVRVGRKYSRSFNKLKFYHGAGLAGDVVLLVWSGCAEPFSEAAPQSATAAPLVDVVMAIGAWNGLAANLRMHPAGGAASNATDYNFGAAMGSAPVGDYAFGQRWNSITQGAIALQAAPQVPMLAGRWPDAATFDIEADLTAKLAGGAFRPTFSDVGFGILQTNGGLPGVQQVGDSPGVEVGMADNTGAVAVYWREMGAPYGDGSLGKTVLAGLNMLAAPFRARWRVKPATLTADAQVELYVNNALAWSRKLPPDYGVVRRYLPWFVSSTDQGNALLFKGVRYRARQL